MVLSARSRPAWFVVAGAALLAGACGASGVTTATVAPTTSVSTATTTLPHSTTLPRSTSTVPRSTTTTTGPPPSPQPSDQAAAQALISAWADGNKTAALAVATASTVDDLFAFPYPVGNAVFRGCTVSFPPLVCTFGAPGGGNPNAAIIEVSVTQIPAGWYDSAVVVET